MVGAIIDSCITSLLNEKAAVPVRLVLGSALLVSSNYGFVINGDAKLSRVWINPDCTLNAPSHITKFAYAFPVLLRKKIGRDDFKQLKEVKDLCHTGS